MQIILKILISWLVLSFAGIAITPALADASAAKPNIVIVFSDDQGYADLGVQGILSDIRTPHIDALAADGIRFTDGYITAPQCSPSRAGLLSGRYQQRFGFDDVRRGPMPEEEITLAEALKDVGYATGMVGKWHVQPSPGDAHFINKHRAELYKPAKNHWHFPDHLMLPFMPEGQGFDEYYCGWTSDRDDYPMRLNFLPNGANKGPKEEGIWMVPGGYRVDQHNAAGLDFVERHAGKQPFFLYQAYSIPHVPLEAPQHYLDRFPGEMPERRRYALAMMAAMDDGVGAIVKLLKERGEYENTLFVFTSDNGAPLKVHMKDTLPVDSGGWDGSRNDPLNGEKGMLSEGGIRVPFIITWPNGIPQDKVYRQPISALDIYPTALAAAGQSIPDRLDGVNLLPYFASEKYGAPHEFLYWRFWSQSAVRSGPWKLLRLGDQAEFLYNLEKDIGETTNLIDAQPQIASQLRAALETWAKDLQPPRLPAGSGNGQEKLWYRHYLK